MLIATPMPKIHTVSNDALWTVVMMSQTAISWSSLLILFTLFFPLQNLFNHNIVDYHIGLMHLVLLIPLGYAVCVNLFGEKLLTYLQGYFEALLNYFVVIVLGIFCTSVFLVSSHSCLKHAK